MFKCMFELFLFKTLVLANLVQSKSDLILSQLSAQNIQRINMYQVINVYLEEVTKKSLPNLGFLTNVAVHDFDNRTDFIRALESKDFKSALLFSLIIFYSTNLANVEAFVDLLAEKIEIQPRPKCSTIFLSQSNETVLDSFVDQLLRYAWKEKFLDFSVILIDIPIIYHHNPFFNSTSKQTINQKTQIFPDKMTNVNKYPIKVSDVSYAKYDLLVAQKDGKLVGLGTNSFLVEFILETMGFFMVIDRNVLMQSYDVAGTLMLSTVGEYQLPISSETRILLELVAVVPTSTSYELIFSRETIFHVILATFTIFLFAKILKAFGAVTEFSKPFSLALVLLGQSVPYVPRKVIDKLIFLLMTLLFVYTSNELYSNIVEVRFKNDDLSFKTYKDLDRSNLTFYVTVGFLKFILLEDLPKDQYLINVGRRTWASVDADPDHACVKKLIKTRKFGCIMTRLSAESFVSTYRNPDGSARMKIAEPMLFTTSFFYTFLKPVPCVVKFAKIVRRINEAGISHMIALYYKKKRIQMRRFVPQETLAKKKANFQQFLIIFCTGQFIALLAFFLEFLFMLLKKKYPRLVQKLDGKIQRTTMKTTNKKIIDLRNFSKKKKRKEIFQVYE